MGIGFMVFGFLQLLPAMMQSHYFYPGVFSCAGLTGSYYLFRAAREWRFDRRVQGNLEGVSKAAAEWIPMLYGNYTPFVIEAAEKLGEARETAAAPALMHALEQTVNTQPPGWCDTAEAMVIALGKIGDRRALALLYRLSNVRGIGLRNVILEAVDRIEPETSLLRPGSETNLPPELLLRPVDFTQEADPTTLLRADRVKE